jgi:hypothetical protein
MNNQRKFLLILPLLVIPFLTMAFWALGGGKTTTALQTNKGLDASLPEAQFKKEKDANKMTVYQTARRDSAQNGVSSSFIKAMGITKPDSADENAKRIQVKLAAINKQISQPVTPITTYDPETEASEQKIKQLHRMMRSANRNSQEDPEMVQLSKMLTQIQAIQNPGSVKISKKPEDNKPFKAIPAMIDGKQKVVDGGAVRLKLTDSVRLKDQWIPKGQQIYGVCSVTNQRLLLTIQNIRLDKQIIPVNLTVFSLDGMPGIPAPEAELGGAAGNGARDAVQSMQFLTMDQSLGAQAAAGGVNAAKGLFSKKVKKIKVKLKDEYPVLLKINK